MFFGRKFWFAMAGWWLLWPLFHYLILRKFWVSEVQALIDALVSNALLAACCLGMVYTLRDFRPSAQQTGNLALRVIALTWSWSWITQQLLPHIGSPAPDYLNLLRASMGLRMLFGMLIIGIFLLGAWVRHFLREQEVGENRRQELEKLSREAELLTLRQQLQPHFLFNTLNSISALAGTRSEEARKMIHQLSDFLRGTLHKDDHALLSLEEEVGHLRLYLDIEKVRFGHRLKTEITAAEDCLKLQLPALILQPLVENAIKFGLYDTLEAVTISVAATCDAKFLHLKITNPFDPETVRAQKGTGFGLNSVQRRLFLLFHRPDLLQTSASGNTFTVTLRIPR